MKPTQRLRYAERIEKVIRHLQSHMDETPPDLQALARVAAMSDHHFHRVFRLMTGENVGEVLRRVRLARAVPALSTAASVAVAADASGYSTPQSLARALRQQVGLSPTASRSAPEMLARALQRARPVDRRPQDPIPALTIDIVSVEPLRLLSIRNVGAYAELNRAYQALFELVTAQVDAGDIRGIYGIQFDDAAQVEARNCRALCGLDVGTQGEARGELTEYVVPAGEYVRIHHRGAYDAIAASIDTLYAYVLGTLDRDLAAHPAVIHYCDDPDTVAEPALRSDVYLPLA